MVLPSIKLYFENSLELETEKEAYKAKYQ